MGWGVLASLRRRRTLFTFSWIPRSTESNQSGSSITFGRGAKARQALRLALAPSRSPLETKASLLLTLPSRLGGYGLPRPEVNCVIMPRAEDVPLSQFAKYEVDICWPSRKTVVEVDSYQYHSTADQLDRDAKKRNSLKSMGWKVSTVTAGQLSGDALEVLVRQLARDLGVRGHSPSPMKRDWLIDELL